MQPEEVLELIGSAPERYDTVRAALRYRGDGPMKKEIRERIVRRAFQVSPREAYKPIRHLEPDGPFGWRCRAWHADQYHWRIATEVLGGGVEITTSKGRRRLPTVGRPAAGWCGTAASVQARVKTTPDGLCWPPITTGPSTPCSRTRSAGSPTHCAL